MRDVPMGNNHLTMINLGFDGRSARDREIDKLHKVHVTTSKLTISAKIRFAPSVFKR